MECNDKEMQSEKQRDREWERERERESWLPCETVENGEYEMQSNGFKFFINT